MTSLVIRLYRRRFKLVIKDGSLTRLDHKICVPILWTLEAFRESVVCLAGLWNIYSTAITERHLLQSIVLNPLYRH